MIKVTNRDTKEEYLSEGVIMLSELLEKLVLQTDHHRIEFSAKDTEALRRLLD